MRGKVVVETGDAQWNPRRVIFGVHKCNLMRLKTKAWQLFLPFKVSSPPKKDNGLKNFWGLGTQVVKPLLLQLESGSQTRNASVDCTGHAPQRDLAW